MSSGADEKQLDPTYIAFGRLAAARDVLPAKAADPTSTTLGKLIDESLQFLNAVEAII